MLLEKNLRFDLAFVDLGHLSPSLLHLGHLQVDLLLKRLLLLLVASHTFKVQLHFSKRWRVQPLVVGDWPEDFIDYIRRWLNCDLSLLASAGELEIP